MKSITVEGCVLSVNEVTVAQWMLSPSEQNFKINGKGLYAGSITATAIGLTHISGAKCPSFVFVIKGTSVHLADGKNIVLEGDSSDTFPVVFPDGESSGTYMCKATVSNAGQSLVVSD